MNRATQRAAQLNPRAPIFVPASRSSSSTSSSSARPELNYTNTYRPHWQYDGPPLARPLRVVTAPDGSLMKRTTLPLHQHRAPGRYLLVFDLNGVLLYRSSSRNGGTLRPFARKLLDRLLVQKRSDGGWSEDVTVMLWSSIMPSSYERVAKSVLCKSDTDGILTMWDRRECDLNGSYNSKADCVKDLSRIWSTMTFEQLRLDVPNTADMQDGVDDLVDSAARASISPSSPPPPPPPLASPSAELPKGPWSAANTIIVDDSPTKIRRQPQNQIMIGKYKGPSAHPDDNELETLIAYLDKLFGAQPADVRQFMAEHPWTDFAQPLCNPSTV